jgi:hypothetical protein
MKGLLCFFCCLQFFLGFSQSEHFTVKSISLNDEKPHFGLSFAQNNQVLYTSYKLNKNGKVKTYLTEGILSLYVGDKTESGDISNVKPLLIDSKEDIWHITSAFLSTDGKKLYVTTNYINRKSKPKGDFKETNFHIEIAEYIEGIGWTNFKVLPFCKPQYSYAHPSLSSDGKTLYFTANIRGGKEMAKGPSDIFKVDVLGENTYSEPKNLGSQVNSYSGEMFPFISHTNTLYFASNRLNGFGGFDIYKSDMNEKGVFQKAKLLPQPINSKEDDLCFVIESNGKSGYFSSKRKEGKGEDDIYYFTVE